MSNSIYSWGEGIRFSGSGIKLDSYVEPEDFHREFSAIEKQNGIVRPENVLDRARNKRSKLHKAFTWDDSEAAERYRLQQASMMIRSIKVEVISKKGETVILRAAPQIMTPDRTRGYKSLPRVFENQTDREYVLQQVLNQLIALRRRWNDYSELAEVYEAMEHVGKAIDLMKAKVAEEVSD